MSLATKLKLVAACPHCGNALRPVKRDGGSVCKRCNNPLKRVFSARRMGLIFVLTFVCLILTSVALVMATGKVPFSLVTMIGMAIGGSAVGGFHYIKDAAQTRT